MSDFDRQEQIELLLDHYQNPRNFGEMKDADVSVEGGNPGCGDIITIYLQMENGQVINVSFTGEGCTISQAATSILTEEIQGASLQEIEQMDYKLIADWIGSEMVNTRPKCATLGLDTLKKAVRAYQEGQIRKQLGE